MRRGRFVVVVSGIAIGICLILPLVPALAGSAPVLDWQRSVPGYAHGIDASNAGDVYVVSETWRSTEKSYVSHFDATGALLWRRPIGQRATNARANGVAVAPDGGAFVVGSLDTKPETGGSTDMDYELWALWRVSPTGSILWHRGGGSRCENHAWGTAVDVGRDRVAIAISCSGRTWDDRVRAFDLHGYPVWHSAFEVGRFKASSESIQGLGVDRDGQVSVAGTIGRHGVLQRITRAGDVVWTRTWSDRLLHDVAVLEHRTMVVGTFVKAPNGFVGLVSRSGDMVWQRRWAAEPGYVAITPTGAGWVLDWSYARIYGFSPAGRLSWTLKVRFSGVDVATTSDATYVCNAQDQVFRYLTS